MPPARDIKCIVVSVVWLTPTVFELRFSPRKRFKFEGGQFVSVRVPDGKGSFVRRAYSLACGPEIARDTGIYSLCIKLVPGGKGSQYLSQLKAGDVFEAKASYGEFKYRPIFPERNVCFIATGTGIAPFKSMLESALYQNSAPGKTLLIFGASNRDEILYADELERLGVQFVPVLSRQETSWKGFRGRVTDYLKALPVDFPFHNTEFYICGNGIMIAEVSEYLRNVIGISNSQIHKESFGGSVDRRAAQAKAPTVRRLIAQSTPNRFSLRRA